MAQKASNLHILVTGGNGQLGHELRRCLEEGHSELGAIPAIYANAQVDYIDYVDLDISDALAVDAWFNEHARYDVVINCAAVTNVDGCEQNFAQAFAANALGPMNMARACERTQTKLVQVSTDYVFPGTCEGDRTESDAPAPISAYGRSKLAGEGLALSANPKTFVVRTAWLYGYVGSNFVKTMLRLAETHKELLVVDDQLGNPTSANDLAHQILCLSQSEEYGIYHATCEGTCSWASFAQTIMDAFHTGCTIVPCSSKAYKEAHPASADRPHFSSLDNEHLRQSVGNSMRPWQEAFASYCKNYAKLAK